MSGLSRSSANLDPRRKRLLFRAWHRGTREMDLIFGRFAESAIDTLDEAGLAALEALIDVADRDLFEWITGADPVPARYDTPAFRSLKAFHAHARPVDF